MIRRLVVSHGHRERELALVGTIVVGRDPECDVSEDGDALLSRRHTEFTLGPNGVIVRDLGSRNGTFINGVKTVESPVNPGDVVQIGHLLVRLIEGDAPLPLRSTPAVAPPDDDVTRVVRAPRPPATPTSGPPPDDDRTMVTSPPPPAVGSPHDATRVRSATPQPAAVVDDDRTLVVKPVMPAPQPAPPVATAPPPAAAPAVARPQASEAPRVSAPAPAPAPAAHDGLGGYVFTQVTLLAVIVFLSGASALWVGSDAAGAPAIPLWRLAPGLVVALVATFASATLMTRRLARPGATASGDTLAGTSRLGTGTQTPAPRDSRR